jgi:hypothetical protein
MKLILIIAAFVLGSATTMIISAASASAPNSFDHSQCQYPLRQSNPPNGCDNTDPANPVCMKGGFETCNKATEPEPVQEKPVDKEPVQEQKTCKL